MPEKDKAPETPKEPDIDPIIYSDEQIFGLDPAVHWFCQNNQQEQFPEIVIEIAKHWKDAEWLEKLLNRLGYVVSVYDPDTNPKGILARPLKPRPEHGGGKEGPNLLVRYFLLRCAGIKTEIIHQMFGVTMRDRVPSRISKEALSEVMDRRTELVQKRSSSS